MAYEQKDNSGSMFRNKRREKDSQPNVTGKAMVGGVMYYMDAWTKTTGDGEKWQSVSFKPVDQQQPAPSRPPAPLADMDDEIPW
jgi:hypothetical protein